MRAELIELIEATPGCASVVIGGRWIMVKLYREVCHVTLVSFCFRHVSQVVQAELDSGRWALEELARAMHLSLQSPEGRACYVQMPDALCGFVIA